MAAAPFLIGSAAHAQWSSAYAAPRNALVNASGARSIEVEAGAGSLRVEGKPGLNQVQVSGMARSSSQQFLNQIKLIAERRGDVVFIKADRGLGRQRRHEDIQCGLSRGQRWLRRFFGGRGFRNGSYH